jgi:4-hydroxybenzoate polyprenyltransferase
VFTNFIDSAASQHVVILLLASWMVHWTWVGCVREARDKKNPHSSLALRFRRYRWISLLFFAFGVASALLSSAGAEHRILRWLVLFYVVAQLAFGYSGFVLQAFLRRNATKHES